MLIHFVEARGGEKRFYLTYTVCLTHCKAALTVSDHGGKSTVALTMAVFSGASFGSSAAARRVDDVVENKRAVCYKRCFRAKSRPFGDSRSGGVDLLLAGLISQRRGVDMVGRAEANFKGTGCDLAGIPRAECSTRRCKAWRQCRQLT